MMDRKMPPDTFAVAVAPVPGPPAAASSFSSKTEYTFEPPFTTVIDATPCVTFTNLPAQQLEHADATVAARWLTAQDEHAVAPAAGANLPAAQSLHATPPA